MEWTVLSILIENLVKYFAGSYGTFALITCAVFIIVLVSLGMNFNYAFVFTLPLLGGFVAIGYFGSATWILHMALVAVAVIYAFALIKLTGGN